MKNYGGSQSRSDRYAMTCRRIKLRPRNGEEMTMEPKGFVIQSGQGPVWDRSEGRSVALKLLSGETGESIMMFEETAPPGTATGYHLHHNSDEIAYVLSREITLSPTS